jgi:hypothetical protein
VLTCASCGWALSSLTAKGRYSYFYCLGRFSRRTDCREPYVAQEQLERIVEQVYGSLKLSEKQENQLRTALEREHTDEVSFSVEKARWRGGDWPTHNTKEKSCFRPISQTRFPSKCSSAKTRIAKEIDSAQAEIAEAASTDSPYREMLETALSYMRDAQRGYAQADPYVKRPWNRTLIERITIKGGQLSGVELKQPYHGLFLLASSNKSCLVGGPGFEPGASRSRTVVALGSG